MGLLSKAIRGFHASPHKFDKVRIRENLGKGEGAQVYGNGFYIAEAEPTMQSYYDIFKEQSGPLLLDGRVVDSYWDEAIKEQWPDLMGRMRAYEKDLFTTIIANLSLTSSDSGARHVIKNLNAAEKKVFDTHIAPKLQFPPPPEAHRYELEVATDDSRLLNWDKILGDQPDEIFDAVRPQLQKQQEIMEAARKRALDKGTDWKGRPLPSDKVENLSQPLKHIDEYTGEQVYKLMGITDDMGRPSIDQKQGYQLAADRLHAAGIDGTKYLDQLSRPSMGNEDFPVANPTHNYAIWNDDIINILRRYGVPIGATGAAGGLLSRLNSQSEA